MSDTQTWSAAADRAVLTPAAPASPSPARHESLAGHEALEGPERFSAPGGPGGPFGSCDVPAWWPVACQALVWASLLVVVTLWLAGGGLVGLTTVWDVLSTSGRLTALLASDLLLIQTLLMARIPFVERVFGQDDLARAHAELGISSVTLMGAHIALSVAGEAGSTSTVLSTLWTMIWTWPGMLMAALGTACLLLVLVTSVRAVRSRLRHETWHLLHLYAYLGVFFAVPHQLWSGTDFENSPVASAYWWALWIAAAGSMLLFRVLVPLYRTRRHRLVVTGVRTRGAVTTVTMTGRRLDRLHAQAGQFFQWRFLGRPGWTRAHPYSLSAAPDGRTLQISVAAVGDGSRELADLEPGTRVAIEGPYGRMHPGVRTRRRVVLFAGGIGVAPMKSLLEGLEQAPGDVTLVYRAGAGDDVPLLPEVSRAAADRGAQLRLVAGHRATGRDSWLPQEWAAQLGDAEAILTLAPDIRDADVYVCGAPEWMDRVTAALADLGVDADHVHLERFAY